MRYLGIEDQLDEIIENNPQFKADWYDAQNIDLNDEMIQLAISDGLINQEIIEQIRNVLNNDTI